MAIGTIGSKPAGKAPGRRAVLLGLGGLALTGLGGCSRVRQSRLNPRNWFGRSREEAPSLAPRGGYTVQSDRRGVVANVVSMQVDRLPGGALITATGLPPTQGFWDAELVPIAVGTNDRPLPENGVMTFDFRIERPLQPRRQGTQQSRELSATVHLTDQDLAGVSRIVVRGQNNQRSARR